MKNGSIMRKKKSSFVHSKIFVVLEHALYPKYVYEALLALYDDS